MGHRLDLGYFVNYRSSSLWLVLAEHVAVSTDSNSLYRMRSACRQITLPGTGQCKHLAQEGKQSNLFYFSAHSKQTLSSPAKLGRRGGLAGTPYFTSGVHNQRNSIKLGVGSGQ